MKNPFLFICILSVLFSCSDTKKNSNTEAGTDSKSNEDSTISYTNPVLPGDFADPSVVRVGNDYYATATSSEWAPLYPILHSTNLVDWEIIGHVFPDSLPDWAEAHFWAPEISYDKGKFYVYYTAKKKGGPLCTGVASAANAEGPYTDHGALVCQDVGAIDGFAIRDENGDLYLIWKEDGNSQGKPTPMWGQRMNEERTELLGEKFELFRNDPGTWEGGLVEGAFLLRRGDYYYAFYSGDKCCGRQCTYGVGVARAKNLKGPWEKYENNPLMKQNDNWKCAGHGSMVTDTGGNDYFLYHAYSTDGFVYTGRQGLLDKITWGEDGWPSFSEDAPSANVNATEDNANQRDLTVEDNFSSSELAHTWQWPVTNFPEYSLDGEKGLTLQASPEKIGSILAQRTLTADYSATTAIDISSLDQETRAGLTAIGDPNKAVGIAVHNNKIVLWSVRGNEQNIIAEATAPEEETVQLKLTTRDGDQMEFAWSTDGDQWNVLNEGEPFDASYLPPWDRAVRVGLTVKGPTDSGADFKWFRMTEI
jgi:xylan 1,4-beta-xylosidase